jgi:hypothetical protein
VVVCLHGLSQHDRRRAADDSVLGIPLVPGAVALNAEFQRRLELRPVSC